MGDSDVSISTWQAPSLPRCQGRTLAGDPCPITPTASSDRQWCFRHDPANADKITAWASDAADASHRGVDDRLDRILARADLDSLEGLAELRRKLLPLDINPRRYQLILQNIGGLEANLREQGKRGPKATPPVIVEVQSFNGAEPSS